MVSFLVLLPACAQNIKMQLYAGLIEKSILLYMQSIHISTQSKDTYRISNIFICLLFKKQRDREMDTDLHLVLYFPQKKGKPGQSQLSGIPGKRSMCLNHHLLFSELTLAASRNPKEAGLSASTVTCNTSSLVDAFSTTPSTHPSTPFVYCEQINISAIQNTELNQGLKKRNNKSWRQSYLEVGCQGKENTRKRGCFIYKLILCHRNNLCLTQI